MIKQLVKISIILLIGFNTTNCLGQFLSQDHSPSASESSVEQTASQNVSFNCGAVDISIPLFEVGVKKLKVPITLSYRTKGIVVGQQASTVGLGWVLSAGGAISRTVKDLPDDYGLFAPDIVGLGTFKGRFWNGQAQRIIDFTPSTVDTTTIIALGWIKDMLGTARNAPIADERVGSGNNDTEPDIFNFSFGSHSGKFIFDVTSTGRTIKMIPYQDIKFNYSIDANGLISQFTAVDETGMEYTFDQSTQVEDSSFFSSGGSAMKRSSVYNSSWYLSKIKHVNGEEVTFTYTNENYEELTTPINFTGTPSGSSVSKTLSQSVKRIAEINTATEKIVFTANHQRQDLYLPSYAITEIGYFEKNLQVGNTFIDQLRRKFTMSYSYFQSPAEGFDGAFASLMNPVPTSAQQSVYYKRLKLDQIQESEPYGASKPPYVFTYNATYQLPYRFSKQQDIWGYFNAASGNTSLIPTIYIYPDLIGSDRLRSYPKSNYGGTNSTVIYGANRTPASDAIMSAGMLTTIKYPSGGYYQYDFQSDSFYYDNENYRGGGLRIKTISQYDAVNISPALVKNYSYNNGMGISSSGKAISMPVFGAPLSTSVSNPDRANTNKMQPGYMSGNNVGYTQVKEQIGVGSGYTIYKYSIPATHGENDDASGDNLYHATEVKSAFTNLTIQNHNLMTGTSFTLLSRNIQLQPNTFPFPTNMEYEWNRGQMISKEIYDNNGSILHKTKYTYKLFYSNPFDTLAHVYGIKIGTVSNQQSASFMNVIQGAPSPYSYYLLYSKTGHLVDCAKVLASKEEIDYDPVHPLLSLTTKEEYQYDYRSVSFPTVKTITTPTEKKSTRYRYPFTDHLMYAYVTASSNTTAIAFKSLFDKHILGEHLEQTLYINKAGNDYLAASNLMTYRFENSLPVPDVIYDMPLANISTTPVNNQISTTNGSFIMDSRYSEKIGFDGYDSRYQLKQRHERLVNSSYLYGYDQNYLIAKVDNASSNEIAYTSFEGTISAGNDINLGNWQVANPASIYDLDGFTGKKCLSLHSSGGWTDTSHHFINGKKYVVSFWKKGDGWFGFGCNGNISLSTGPTIKGWTYCEGSFTGNSNYNCSFWYSDPYGNPIFIDELRLYPANAGMETYTYQPLIGMTSKCDTRSMVTYYEYDWFGRPVVVRDMNGNITKKTDYAIQQTE